MKRIMGLLFMGLASLSHAQTSHHQELDTLLLLPFPHDTLHFDGEVWVKHSGQIGRLLWTDSSWAWNADTSEAHRWHMQLAANGPLLTLDLSRLHGTQFTPLPADAPGSAWKPTPLESNRLGARVRLFTDDTDTLVVAAADGFPPAHVIANWHPYLEATWRNLLPLPRQVTPLGFAASDGSGWSFVEVHSKACFLVTEGVWLFDPKRTLMDVVRERKAQR